ncbi:PepSY domain-containing protein [Streptomyces sp. YIM 98790]|uniref:PepSY-associated TM helix domain-containing protein n=1 Tax=Streptomyces sp. YIM 98790 TaxID=2689077 RepID=UPI00140B322E|nr:PepSY domain-containing protein [Streptomyces sp. YIM 98790]
MSTTSVVSPRAAGDPPRGPAPRRGFGPLLRRLHFYAGVLVAPFLVLTALTGLAYAFAPQLEQLVYREELTVREAAGDPRPLAEQIDAALAGHPEGTLSSVLVPDGPDATTRVVLSVPGLGAQQRTVYVDPYTAEVTGALTTDFGSPPLTTWLSGLHGSLHLGDTGRLYSELAASWLWVLALAGLVLWLRHSRGRRRRGPRGVLLPERTARGVRRSRGMHASAGVWLALGLLVLSATGLTWSQYAGGRFDALQGSFDSHAPAVATALPGAADGTGEDQVHHGDGTHDGHAPAATATADRALAVARDAGLDGPVKLTPPPDAGHGWTVAQDDKVWPVRLDTVAVDPASGEVLDRVRFADHPVLAKLSTLGIQAHMGRLFGLANQIVLAAVALGLLWLIGHGYRMWWQRRPLRDTTWPAPGRPPARGAWRHVPRPLLLLGVPAVVFIGWALPVLGVSLLAFVLLDLLTGAARRRRQRSGDTA